MWRSQTWSWTSLNSRITAVVLGLAAEIEREFISARTTEALARRKAEGKPVGRQKGSKNKDKRLDNAKDQILDLLKTGVHKTSIARIIKCHPETLYEWMYENGLGAYIKSRKPALKKRDDSTGKNQKKRDDKAGVVVPTKKAKK